MKYLLLILSFVSFSAFGMESENRAHNASRVAMAVAYFASVPSIGAVTTLPVSIVSNIFPPVFIAGAAGLATYGLWKAGESIYSGYTKPANAQQ